MRPRLYQFCAGASATAAVEADILDWPLPIPWFDMQRT